ncbi:hypothetical protein [Chryseolinea lacunae]|uniref:Phage portal protein n=1 Tax=Chryseolinea lacunae TaxID=2801331 RepID=A0ABS1KN10_9BACT|nr:hypothetical protein [Chryseolinea lacunae]MBL0740853.1 hypothetical protein [Chryseolinea lacunae]
MNQEQVPQDKENLNEGKLAKLYYATDEKGHYVKVNSIGWEPETVAMQQAWDVVNDDVEEARQKVLAGKASPLLYQIKKHIMTPGMVASYAGTFGFMVRLHCLPSFFGRLSKKQLEKYAYTFRITVEELTDVERLKNPK